MVEAAERWGIDLHVEEKWNRGRQGVMGCNGNIGRLF